MTVFLCWSGTRSRAVAECLKTALLKVGLGVEMSPDIAKGEIWFQRITNSLRGAHAGIVVLTLENVRSPWLHFEAGVLQMKMGASRRAKPTIFPYLFHTEPVAIDGPLGQYQLTVATKEDTSALVEQPLQYKGRRPAWRMADKKKWWTALAGALQRKAATLRPTEVAPTLSTLFNRKTFREPVQKCVGRSWLQRYNGAQSTLESLRRIEPDIARQCRPYASELLQRLIEVTDTYAMAMAALLLKELECELDRKGDLVLLPPGIRKACESRRIEALQLQAALVAETQAPVFDESPAFERLDTFAQRKDVVHRKEAEIQLALKDKPPVCEWWKPPLLPEKDALRTASTSTWMLDRILYYVVRREQGNVPLEEATAFVCHEWEIVRAPEGGPPSRMALHYSLGVLEKTLGERKWRVNPPTRRQLERVFRRLDALERQTSGSRVAERVNEMRARMGGESSISTLRSPRPTTSRKG